MEKPFWLLEVWTEIRPYLICIVADFLICALAWLVLWALYKWEVFLPVPGWPSDVTPTVHGLGTVALVALFMAFLLHDVYRIRTGRRK